MEIEGVARSFVCMGQRSGDIVLCSIEPMVGSKLERLEIVVNFPTDLRRITTLLWKPVDKCSGKKLHYSYSQFLWLAYGYLYRVSI